ncbi:MAG: FRG domain-containing protein [Candidatus Hodarchaeota archaeon]
MTKSDYRLWQLETVNVLYDLIEKDSGIKSTKTYLQWGDEETSDYGNILIVEAESYTSLIRVVGGLKSHFSDRNIKVLLRGQKSHYKFLQWPKLFRWNELLKYIDDLSDPWSVELPEGVEPPSDYPKRIYYVNNWLESVYLQDYIRKTRDLKKGEITNLLAWEPVMQHYGYKTRWLDLVDNVPIAVWFASDKDDSKQSYGYIFVYGVRVDRKIARGVWEGIYHRLIDLREATGPRALRPHMQHAFSLLDVNLLKLTPDDFSKDIFSILAKTDYSKYLLCIIKVRNELLKEWVYFGDENTSYHLSKCNIFPSPEHDDLFKTLLEHQEMLDEEEDIELTKIIGRIDPMGYDLEDF